MAEEQAPVVLELAPLPREQIGPFLLLGLDKAAGPKEIEAHWAERVKWARKNQIPISLEDINWARQVINDLEKRVRADAASLNADTAEGLLRKLAERYGTTSEGGPSWQPLDVEKPLDEYTPAAEIPDLNEARAAAHVPEVPREVHAVATLLEQLVQEPLDPWKLDFPPDTSKDPAP
jgi:hypothetical protein